MCLLVLAWQVHPRYRLVVAANRDEFHERAAAPLAKWPAPYDILAGRDLRAQGTWLGVDRQRRFGVVTNLRELQRPRPNAPSRGSLIPQYLSAPGKPAEFLAALEAQAPAYSGFNLLLAARDLGRPVPGGAALRLARLAAGRDSIPAERGGMALRRRRCSQVLGRPTGLGYERLAWNPRRRCRL